jgi:hypothetical protein
MCSKLLLKMEHLLGKPVKIKLVKLCGLFASDVELWKIKRSIDLVSRPKA